jgi:hypothetical protein
MQNVAKDLFVMLDGDKAAGGTESDSASTATSTATAPASTLSPAPDPAAVKVIKRNDGSTFVDDRFVLRGQGTKDDPYKVTWEQLVSANETYQPRLGRTIIPGRLKMLDGKWVKVSGYIAFPIMAQSADEMLVMLNQWDGCCIGVPPTPYDAIEVKLKVAAKGDVRQRQSGAVTGILRVDPYLVKGWLVSLFLMDEGEINETAGQTTPGQHATNKAPTDEPRP